MAWYESALAVLILVAISPLLALFVVYLLIFESMRFLLRFAVGLFGDIGSWWHDGVKI